MSVYHFICMTKSFCLSNKEGQKLIYWAKDQNVASSTLTMTKFSVSAPKHGPCSTWHSIVLLVTLEIPNGPIVM